jgi:hypothetical protein
MSMTCVIGRLSSNLQKVTFDVRGSAIVRQSIAGVFETDYYAFAFGTSSQIDLRESYAGHFYNQCAGVSTPWVSLIGLDECGFKSSDESIVGQSFGTFAGVDFNLALPPFINLPGLGYADLDYNYTGGLNNTYANINEMKRDIINGADSPIYPNRIATQIVQPIITASRWVAARLLDKIYSH